MPKAIVGHQVGLSEIAVLNTQAEFWLEQLADSVNRSGKLDFAATSQRNCKPTSFPCGRSCQPAKTKSGKPTQCKKILQGQAATHADWLKQQSAKINTSGDATQNDAAGGISGIKTQEQKKAVLDLLDQWEESAKELADFSPPPKLTLKEIMQGKHVTYSPGQRMAVALGIIQTLKQASAHQSFDNQFRATTNSKGEIETMGLVDVEKHGDEPCLYINRLVSSPKKTASGSGKRFIQQLVVESQKLGFGGRLKTSPIGDSEGFYKKMGFVKSRVGLVLEPNAAKTLLTV